MATYLIAFETFPPSLAVQEQILIDAIKGFGNWARPTSKTWLIKTFLTREQVINQLRANAGPNDKLLVMLVSNDWISVNLSSDVVNWMKSGM